MQNRIREERLARGWSVVYLADRADVARQTIHTLESNPAYTPKGSIMARIAGAFGVELSAIFLTDTPVAATA